jgi:hypothetical protein
VSPDRECINKLFRRLRRFPSSILIFRLYADRMINRAAQTPNQPLPSYDKALKAYQRDRADILSRDTHASQRPDPSAFDTFDARLDPNRFKDDDPREGQVSSPARSLQASADGSSEKLKLVDQSRTPSSPTSQRTYDVNLDKGEITVSTSTQYQSRIVPGGIMGGREGLNEHYVIDTKNQTIAAFNGQ